MSFTIPNNADTAARLRDANGLCPLASPDAGDFAVLTAGDAGTGVVSGGAVTAQGSPDMTVAVAAGVVRFAALDAGVAVAAGNVTITANATAFPRLDLVVVSTAGVKSAIAGTPGSATAGPVWPAFTPTTQIVLALVYVEPSDTTIQSDQIVDKRVLLAPPAVMGHLMALGY